MIKDYAVNSITWESKVDSGYGPTFEDGVNVDNVYVEDSIQLLRNLDNETSADGLVICFEDLDFEEGDRITTSIRSYIIMNIAVHKKARSLNFDHVELLLKEVNNG